MTKYRFFNGSQFIERLKRITKKNQRQIADDLDKAPSIITDWANDRRAPSVDDLLRISKEYNCSLDYLLGIYEHSDELGIDDICRYLIEIDNAQNLHIEILDLSEDKKANYKSKVTMYISPKAKNDHKTEAIIDWLNEYQEVANLNISSETKKDLLNALFSRMNTDNANEKEQQAIISGIFRNIRDL